jgi:hypothetical protein
MRIVVVFVQSPRLTPLGFLIRRGSVPHAWGQVFWGRPSTWPTFFTGAKIACTSRSSSSSSGSAAQVVQAARAVQVE